MGRSRQTWGLSMLFTLSAICSLILKHFRKMVKLGDTVPNFTAATTHGKIDFHTWIEGSWSILFSHPADYTPVCTTELGRAQAMSGEFAVDWRQGGQVIVAPSVKPEDAPGLFPKGVKVHELPSGKGYLRTTPQPE